MPANESLRLSFYQGIRADSEIWYNSLQWLGQGGNAVTYLMVAGSGKFMGNQFAVKIFQNVPKPERRENFLGEVRFLRECEHPSILRIFDEGTYREDHPFVVTEFLPVTLREVIRSRNSSMTDKLSYALQLLSALVYLNSLEPQVIHRDIKPENIFINGASCVLGDFGLMKRLPTEEDDWENHFKESVGPGMPFFYRTPDLVDYALGNSIPTTKSDLFQVGLVLAELFTGRNPEKRAEHDDHLSDVELEQIGFIPGAAHPLIRNLLESMLEMSPDNRPPAEECLRAWLGVFRSVSEQVNAIEGKVF